MDRRTFLKLGLVTAGTVLGRRLLAGSGGASIIVPPTEPGLGSVFTITSPNDGGWSWFGDPRAIHSGDYSYIGYVDSSGNVCIRTFHHPSETVGAEIVLHATLDADDHVHPSLLIRPDGKLQAFYARHEPISTTMHTRVSTSTLASDPDLSDGFAAEVDLDASLGAVSYDYPVPLHLSAEGLIYLFWRSIPTGSTYELWYSTSSDGDTWATGTTLYIETRGYWKIESNGVDTIHFAVTDDSPNVAATSVAHFKYDGAWRKSDGTDMGAPTFSLADATLVYDGTTIRGWVWDIALAGSTPVIVYPTFPTSSDHRYHYARWNGTAWASTEICAAGGGIDPSGYYSGGICLDHSDPNVVYASREVAAEYEMYRYFTDDNGATFTEDALTSGSSTKNIRPVSVRNHAAPLEVVWMHGLYASYGAGGFLTGMKGYG